MAYLLFQSPTQPLAFEFFPMACKVGLRPYMVEAQLNASSIQEEIVLFHAFLFESFIESWPKQVAIGSSTQSGSQNAHVNFGLNSR